MSLSPKNLARAAARAAGDPAFCGWALARYAESEGVDAAEVARRLGASGEAMGHLHLCLRPAGDRFAVDVRAIAAHAGVDADVLATVMRRADVLDRMRAGPVDAAAGALLAARARPDAAAKPDAADAAARPARRRRGKGTP